LLLSGERGEDGGVTAPFGAGAKPKFEGPASSAGLPAMKGKLLSKTNLGGLSLLSGGVGGVSDPGTVIDIRRMASVGVCRPSGPVEDELAWLGLLEVSLLPPALIILGVESSEESLSLGVVSPGVLGQTGLSQSSNTIYRM